MTLAFGAILMWVLVYMFAVYSVYRADTEETKRLTSERTAFNWERDFWKSEKELSKLRVENRLLKEQAARPTDPVATED